MLKGLRLNGTIVANKKHKLGLEANFATQILTVVDENTSVKEGDVLIEFEDSDLIERIEEMRTTLSNTEEELVIAIENEPWNSPGQNTGVGSPPFSRRSSQPRDRTQVSLIAGEFFTS